MSRADELAEAVADWADRLQHTIEASQQGSVSPFERELIAALHRYRESAPSEETHERVRLRVLRGNPGAEMDFLAVDDEYVEKLGLTHSDVTDCGYVTFYLPKPAPVPEVVGEVDE